MAHVVAARLITPRVSTFDRPRTMTARAPISPLAAQGRVPLAFVGLALAWLGFGAGWITVEPALLALPHSHPHVVALAHAWILGFFVTAACGAVYQIAPVALGTFLHSQRLAWWHLGLHAAGAPGMVWALRHGDFVLLGHFGTFVAMGILLFAPNVWQTVRHAPQRGLVATSLVVAASWLVLTVFLGLLLAANRVWGFLPFDPLALLRVHAHFGLGGFFLTRLQGVTLQLVPMFTMAEVQPRDWSVARVGFWSSQLGLILLGAGLAVHANALALTGAAICVAGVVVSGVAFFRVVQRRQKRALDTGLTEFRRGLFGIFAAMLVGLVLVFPASPWGSAAGGFNAMIYALVVILGGLLPCFLGMFAKIVPFLTWMHAYGPLVGRRPTPSASTLSNPRLERTAFLLLRLGAVVLIFGAWMQRIVVLRVGTVCVATGTSCFLVAMGLVLRHLVRPVSAPASTFAAIPRPS